MHGAKSRILDLRKDELEKRLVEAMEDGQRLHDALHGLCSRSYPENMAGAPWEMARVMSAQMFDPMVESVRGHLLPRFDGLARDLERRASIISR